MGIGTSLHTKINNFEYAAGSDVMIVMTVSRKSKGPKVEYGRLIAFVQHGSAGPIKAIVRWWMQGSTVDAKHRHGLAVLDPLILTKELFLF